MTNYALSNNAIIGSIIVASLSVLFVLLLIVGCIWERYRSRSGASGYGHSIRKRVIVISRPNRIYVPTTKSLPSRQPSPSLEKRSRLSSTTSSAGPDSVFSESSSAPLVPPEVLIQSRFVTHLKARPTLSSTDSGEGDFSEAGSYDRIFYEFPLDPAWEVPRQNLTMHEVLGSGAFGIVRRGQVRDLPGRPGVTTVAVKMLKRELFS